MLDNLSFSMVQPAVVLPPYLEEIALKQLPDLIGAGVTVYQRLERYTGYNMRGVCSSSCITYVKAVMEQIRQLGMA